MKDLSYYLSLPWTVRREEYEDDGRYIALLVEELPGFVVASNDESELTAEFWPTLQDYLSAVLAAGREPKMPPGSLMVELREIGPPAPTIKKTFRGRAMGMDTVSTGSLSPTVTLEQPELLGV